ncbi:CubicO group peptidase (beta-lactamase class C family) [Nakamurella sp. UYEF19]|uniref:serine hydrolase domain-containing protein n=1 Tax=Nakamurella sp. UYEF19 TaxID=1756392 RepID=UPI00339721CB
MSGLRTLLEGGIGIGAGVAPGAVALLARGAQIEAETAGFVDIEGTAPMSRDTIFRLSSVTKPIIAAAVMVLIDDGRLTLDDHIATWLPELSAPKVVRTPQSPADDVVPANRSITVEDLLSSRAGYGFPSDFSMPAISSLFSELGQGSAAPQRVPAPDEWMARLARIPMLHQPGEAWLYNACSELQGVLVARVTGRPLFEFLAERIFGPLKMIDTGFEVPAAKMDRFTSFYQAGADGLHLVDGPDGLWSRSPDFQSGAGGLVSTVDDWFTFGRMLLRDGSFAGVDVLSPKSVSLMTTDHLTADQRAASTLFLEGQGWGYGGAVDFNHDDPWTNPGRYGWVGGTGTSAHIDPSRDTVSILFTQLEHNDPTAPTLMRDFWCYAAGVAA